MIKKHNKFNPIKCGLVKNNDSTDEYFIIIDYKVIAVLIHWNYAQGTMPEWEILKVIHCVDGSTKTDSLFKGRIPTNDFANQLFKNINL